jgi:hypothetical protein
VRKRLLILSDENALDSSPQHYPRDTEQAVAAARRRLENAGLDWRSAAIEARYARVAEIHRDVTTEIAQAEENVLRQTRPHRDASRLGDADLRRHHDLDVSKHFQLRQDSRWTPFNRRWNGSAERWVV